MERYPTEYGETRSCILVLMCGGSDSRLHFLREARIKVLNVDVAVEGRAVGRAQLPQLQLHSYIHCHCRDQWVEVRYRWVAARGKWYS